MCIIDWMQFGGSYNKVDNCVHSYYMVSTIATLQEMFMSMVTLVMVVSSYNTDLCFFSAAITTPFVATKLAQLSHYNTQ